MSDWKSEMIISRQHETFRSLDALRGVLKDAGWSDVLRLLSEMNIYMESFNVLCTEGPPYRIQGGMRDIGLHLGNWRLGIHEDQSDDHLVNVDSGGESETEKPSFFDDDDCPPSASVTTSEFSVTVGLPRRFGNPLVSEEGLESQEAEVSRTPAGTDPSSECTMKTSIREISRKVAVNESALCTAIDSLGGGVKGLKAVVDFVKHFQESGVPVAGDVNTDSFTRGLEQFCLVNGQAKEGAVVPSLENMSQDRGLSGTAESETQQTGGVAADQNRLIVPNLPIRGQYEWTRNAPNGDIYTMGYMENMSGYFPNFCYPYPPPFAGYGPFNLGVRPMFMPMMGVPYFTPPSLEYMHSSDAITRASRKSRIAKRRVHGNDQNQPRLTIKAAAVGGAPVQIGRQDNLGHQSVAAPSAKQGKQGLSTDNLVFLLAKQLSPSGVSSLGRIVLPKKEAEAHLPHLVASEGVFLPMTDFDSGQAWLFRYRFWSNNKSRMYLLENTRDFVKAHNLQERDMLVLYRDAEGSYVVRGEKVGAIQRDTTEEITRTAEEHSQKRQKVQS